MTSLLNLPATYTYQRSHTGLFSVFIDNVLLSQYWSLEEAKWNAKRHYEQNNWTEEDEAEQEYFDRHPIEEK